MLNYLLAGVADKMIDGFDFMLKQEQPFGHCFVERIVEKPDSPVLGNSTLIQKKHFRKIYIVCWDVEILEPCRKKMHVNHTDSRLFKKWKHFQMLKADNETL